MQLKDAPARAVAGNDEARVQRPTLSRRLRECSRGCGLRLPHMEGTELPTFEGNMESCKNQSGGLIEAHDAAPDRGCRGLRAVFDFEFAEDALEVGFDCAFGERERARDFTVGLPGDD